MKENENKIIRTYNGCEVTITFGGKDDTALDEVKRLILESYMERIERKSRIEMTASENIAESA